VSSDADIEKWEEREQAIFVEVEQAELQAGHVLRDIKQATVSRLNYSDTWVL
jgi:hypothetical protein